MLSDLDAYLFYVVNHGLVNSLFDYLMPFITNRSFILLIPVVIWVFVRDVKKALLATVLSALSLMYSDWAVHILKDLIERPRPFTVLEDARVLVGKGRAFSMPSGHAASAFAVVLPFIILFDGATRPILILGALTVAFSRVYVGVHYPFDVLIGAFVGIFSAILLITAYRWSNRKYSEGSFFSIMILILVLISVFRLYYIIAGPLELSPAEAYNWELSRRPDISYLTNGPFIAYVISAGRMLFSDTVFGVRIGAVLFSALSMVVLFLLTRTMYDDRTALYSAVLYQFIPLVSIFGILMTSESIFLLFWIISLYIVWKITERMEKGQKTKWYWMLLGIAIGLGMLSSYSMIFFHVLTFVYMLSDGRLRKILVRPYPYMGVIMSLIIFSPVIIWNAGHNWIALDYLFQNSSLHKVLDVSINNFQKSIGLPFIMVTPVLFILVWIAVFRMRGDPRGKFLFCFSVPLFGAVLATSAIWNVGLNMLIAPYIAGVIAFSFFYLKGFDLLRTGTRYLVGFGLGIAVVMAIVFHYPEELRLPPDRDPSIQFAGWKKLGDTVSTLRTEMAVQGKYFIVADDCMVSSELAFYVKGNPRTYCAGRGEELSQYDLWPGFDDMVNYNAIIVLMNDRGLPEVLQEFNECDSRVFDIKRRKKKLREVTIFDCYGYKGQ